MGFIGWIFKRIFQLVLLLALISCIAFLLQRNNKATVFFNDGSTFSLKHNDNWSTEDDRLGEFVSRRLMSQFLPEFKGGFQKLCLITKGNITLIQSFFSTPKEPDLSDTIVLAANDFDVGIACTHPISGGKKTLDIMMPNGNVFYCAMPEKSVKSGQIISFFYPVATGRFVVVGVDKDLLMKDSSEIYEMLTTATFTAAH